MIGWKRVSLPLLVLLGLSCAGGPPAPDPTRDMTFFPETISITGLEASEDGDVTDIVVMGNFPFNYSSYEPGPDRLVIEVPGAEAGALDEVIPIGTNQVEEVHVETEEYPGGSRIARLEFTGLATVRHDLFLEGNHLRIRFFGDGQAMGEDEESDFTAWDSGAMESEDDWTDSEFADPSDGEPYDATSAWDEEGEGDGEELPWLEVVEDGEAEKGEEDGEEYAGLEIGEEQGPEDGLLGVDEEMAPVPVDPAESLLNLRQDEADDGLIVHLVADGSLTFNDFQLDNPHRAVVDLVGVTNRVPFDSMTIDSEFLNRVRVAQFQSQPERITRVVFDMDSVRDYRIDPHPDGLQVHFAPEDGFPVEAEAPGVRIAEEAGFGEELEEEEPMPPLLAEVGPEFETEPEFTVEDGEEPFVAESDEFGPFDSLDRVDEEGEEEAEEAGAAAAGDPTGSVGEEPMPWEDDGAIDEVESDVEADVEPVEAAPMEPAEEMVEEEVRPEDLLPEGNTLILKAAKDPYTAQAISPMEKLYTGPRISLDFKDADLKDVFRLFHEILGYNIVLDPGVGGKLTIVLDDVPADQALDIILNNNSLDKVFENNVIRVATTQKLAQEAASRRQLMEAKELEQEPLTFARKLSYAKADEVVMLLRQSGGTSTSGGILSRNGTVRFDDRTNTVIITDIPKNIEPINRLLDLLDEETPQVMIESRIVETDRDFERSFGISWGFNVDLDPANGTETNARFPHRVNVDYDVNLPPPASATSLGLSFGNIRDSIDLNFTLEAFELNGDVKILSSPRIAAQNNETAIIEQGVQIPVVNTTATEINVEFISASLRLEVTPQITKDDTIIMDVLVDNSSPDFINRVGDVPPIITERAETLILVENGGTAVIGGIFKLDQSFNEIGVPGLKRIPLLGWLFKNRTVTRGNTELLIFLTPRIITRD